MTLGLTKGELRILKRLNTPIKIQDYLDALPYNHEAKGETHLSPRRVLREQTAHCIEGALLAATALWLAGEKPLLMDLRPYKGSGDYDHVVALYKKNGYWGAISKTNHPTIRFRDPVYKTPRELALSYFHEWFLNTTGKKTLADYSHALDLSKLGTEWVTSEEDLWYLDKKLNALSHYPVVPKGNQNYIRIADPMELIAGRVEEWSKAGKRKKAI
jgi:hypothetical protein